jgi:hypothetical protein
LDLDFVVMLVDGLSTQLQTIDCGVSRQALALIGLQEAILNQRIAFAADSSMQRIAAAGRAHQHVHS